MEEERKFVCKFCKKRYPCGKSLGGHIRTHMTQHCSSNDTIADAVKFDQNNTDATRKKRKKRDLGSDYGLRENPRRTTRFVHSNPTFVHHHHQNDKFCKECGKEFPSLKALCGHMACHSEKEKQKLVTMDTHSNTDTYVLKGSRRMRFMTLNNNPTSSSVSEVEQEQEEEVAMCLMMLSKDFSSHRGRFALVTESNSDNNSVVLEAKSPSADTRIAINNGKNKIKNCVSNNASELVEKKVRKDMKFKVSDSVYFRYGSKKIDSAVSSDGVLRNDVFNRPKMEDSSKYEDCDVSESRKMMNNRCCRSRNTESKKLLLEKLRYAKFDSFKRANNDYLSHNLDEITCKKKHGFPNDEIYKNSSYDSESYENESGEKSRDSTDSDSYPSSSSSSPKPQSSKRKMNLKSKKIKEHECSICNKIFRSGQALGGHKRSHFVGGFEENNNTVILKQDSPSPSPSSHAVPCLIDLNLPAPVDE